MVAVLICISCLFRAVEIPSQLKNKPPFTGSSAADHHRGVGQMRSALVRITGMWKLPLKSSAVIWGGDFKNLLGPACVQCSMVQWYSQVDFEYRAKPPKPPYVDFRVLDDPYQVLSELTTLRDSLQMLHVTAALSRLKNLEHRPLPEVLEEVTSYGQSLVRNASGNDVVGIFVALAKLKFVNLELLNGLANQALRARYISSFSIREVASMVHSIVLLIKAAERKSQTREGRSQGFDPDCLYGMEETDKFLNAMLDELALQRRSDRQMVDRLSSVISSLSLIGRGDSRLDTIMAENLKSVQQMSSLGLDSIVNTILTIGKTGEKQELLAELCNEVEKEDNLKRFEWDRLVTITNALSKLGYSRKGFWKRMFEEMSHPSRVAHYGPDDFEFVLRKAHKQKIDKRSIATVLTDAIMMDEKYERFSDYQLASIIAVLGKYNLGDETRVILLLPRMIKAGVISHWPTSLLSELACACLRFKAKKHPVFDIIAKEMAQPARLEAFDPVSTVRMLYSFTMLDWHHKSTLSLLMGECLQDVHVSSMNKVCIRKLAILLGRTRKSSIPTTLEAYLKRTTSQVLLQEYTEKDLKSIIYHLGRFRDISPESLQPLLAEIGKEERIQAFQPPHISAMILGLSRLGLYDKITVERLCKRAIVDITLLDRLDMVAIMTGLADLNHQNLEVVNALMGHLVKGLKYRGVHLRNLEKILAALVKLDMTHADHCLNVVKELGKKKERLKHATADTICNLLYVMGKEGLVENKLVHQIFRKIGNGKRNGKFDDFDMVRIRQAVFKSGITRTNLLDVVRQEGVSGMEVKQAVNGQARESAEDQDEESDNEPDYGTKLLSVIL